MIAVLGATGRIGRHVAAGLAARGVAGARARPRPGSRRRAAAGRPRRPARPAGRCAPRWTAPSQLFLLTPHGPDQDLVEAAAVAAAARPASGGSSRSPAAPPSLGPERRLQHRRGALAQRAAHRGLRAEFCFLRPSFLMQSVLGLPPMAGLLLAPMGDAPIAMVDARDVADCAVAALPDDDVPADTAWHLTGPAARDVRRRGAAPGRPLRQRAAAPRPPRRCAGAAPRRSTSTTPAHGRVLRDRRRRRATTASAATGASPRRSRRSSTSIASLLARSCSPDPSPRKAPRWPPGSGTWPCASQTSTPPSTSSARCSAWSRPSGPAAPPT